MIPFGQGGTSSSQQEQISATSGLRQRFGGINHQRIGVDNKTVMVVAVVVAVSVVFLARSK